MTLFHELGTELHKRMTSLAIQSMQCGCLLWVVGVNIVSSYYLRPFSLCQTTSFYYLVLSSILRPPIRDPEVLIHLQ